MLSRPAITIIRLIIIVATAAVARGAQQVSPRDGAVDYTNGKPNSAASDAFGARRVPVGASALVVKSPTFQPPGESVFTTFPTPNDTTFVDVLQQDFMGISIKKVESSTLIRAAAMFIDISNANTYRMALDGNLGAKEGNKQGNIHWAAKELPLLEIVKTDGSYLDESLKNTSGGYVLLNDDNDNGSHNTPTTDKYGNTLVKPTPDYNITDPVPEEKDMLPIVLIKHPQGGTYQLDFAFNYQSPLSGIRVWSSPQKQVVNVNGTNITVVSPNNTTFNAAEDNTVYVEGTALSNGAASVQVTLKWAESGGTNYQPVDQVKLTVYQIAGPQYVPERGKYNYIATVPGGGNMTVWKYDNGLGNATNGANTLQQQVTFAAGPATGYVQFSPWPGFIGTRNLYVVKVTVDNSIVTPPTGSATLFNTATAVGTIGLFTAQARVGTSGPFDGILKKQRGVEYMEVGLIQVITPSPYNIDYLATNGTVSNVRFNWQGDPFWDGAGSSTYPWLNSANVATFIPVPQKEVALWNPPGASPTANAISRQVFGIRDRPQVPFQTSNNGNSWSNLNIVLNFNLSISVRTKDDDGNAPEHYFERAEVNWRDDLSLIGRASTGNGQAITVVGGGNTFKTGDGIDGKEVNVPIDGTNPNATIPKRFNDVIGS